MKVKTAAEFGYLLVAGVAATAFFLPFPEPYKAILFGSGILALFARRFFWPLIKPSFCKHPHYTEALYECPNCRSQRQGRSCASCGKFEWVGPGDVRF